MIYFRFKKLKSFSLYNIFDESKAIEHESSGENNLKIERKKFKLFLLNYGLLF